MYVGRTGTDICPVVAILNYLVIKGRAIGLLFISTDGAFLTQQVFVTAVRKVLESAGVDQSKYCGHSFCIGAATTAAAQGVEDSVIKTLGRWESTAYLQYVHIKESSLLFTQKCWVLDLRQLSDGISYGCSLNNRYTLRLGLQ